MKPLLASVLALAMTATAGTASAQQYGSYPTAYGNQGGYYDYARVVRVNPVYDNRGAYAGTTGGERCTESRTYAGGYNDRYNDRGYDPYDRDGDGYDDRYARDGYASRDGYYGRDGYSRPATQGGSTAATVIGGIVGAVLGSQVGGGSARYATSAIGTMVGSQVGKQIYDNAHRPQTYPRVGRVVACDPVSAGAYDNRRASMYDVTYEYAGREYTTRTAYDPGSRIRVRVDVQPQ